MSVNAPIVKLEHVDVDIDGRRILHAIDLELARGRHLGIVGGNGSGKSTLLALIAGTRWPAPGRGRRRYDFGAGSERDAVTARRRIALLGHELQDLYAARGWNFLVRDIVHSGITRSDIPQRRRPVAELEAAETLLARVGLADLANRRLLSLSRGEQRRVLIARALGFEPTALLLDEPVSGLDSDSRRALDATLELVAQHTTLVIAAHRTAELPAVVVDTAALAGGRLVTAGSKAVPGVADEPGALAMSVGAGKTAGPGTTNGPAPTACDTPCLIEVERASVWLDGRAVLRKVDWCLRAGEHWLVTGPNGAGKSTLLRLLHAELRPAAGGRICWPGFGEPDNVWALRRQIAHVSAELQARYRYPTTVFDAIASGFTASIGRTRHLSPDEAARVEQLLVDFELSGLRDRPLATLSYGQRHRSLIARTLAPAPRLLLLDEPWEGLDAASTSIVCERLTDCMRAGTQLICVSHVGPRGLPLNRRLEIADGRIVSAGGSDARRGN